MAQSNRGLSKIGKKAAVWSHHGKHAQVDPALYRRAAPRRLQRWYASVLECLRRERP